MVGGGAGAEIFDKLETKPHNNGPAPQHCIKLYSDNLTTGHFSDDKNSNANYLVNFQMRIFFQMTKWQALFTVFGYALKYLNLYIPFFRQHNSSTIHLIF
jgi:hypothetical protein